MMPGCAFRTLLSTVINYFWWIRSETVLSAYRADQWTNPKQLTIMTGRMRRPPLLVPSCSMRAVWKTTLLYKPHGRESLNQTYKSTKTSTGNKQHHEISNTSHHRQKTKDGPIRTSSIRTATMDVTLHIIKNLIGFVHVRNFCVYHTFLSYNCENVRILFFYLNSIFVM